MKRLAILALAALLLVPVSVNAQRKTLLSGEILP